MIKLKHIISLIILVLMASIIFLVYEIVKKKNGDNHVWGKTKSLKSALILWRGETAAEKGFKDGLRELGYSVRYTIYNAEQKKYKLERILRKVNFEQFDYVYTFGTTATKLTKSILDNSVPQIFNVVTAPVESGIVEKMNSTGANISGVSNMVPLHFQIENALKIIQFKKLGVFFNPRENNSMIIRSQLKELGGKYDFQVVDFRSTPVMQMLQENLKTLINKSVDVDAVYLPSDSFLVTNAELIGRLLKKAKVGSIGAIKKFVDKGVMTGTVVDYYTLGKLAAKIVDKHRKGRDLQDIPVQIQEEPSIVINKGTIDLLNLKISQEVIKNAIIVE